MQYTCKESPVICGICVYPLKKNRLQYGALQCKSGHYDKKKVSLKYKILCLWSMTSTIHASHLEYMYIQVVLYLLFRLQSGCSKFHHWKWTTNFKGFILHVFSLDKLQWNEKKLIFKIKADVYFSYSNSKWAVHKSSKRGLKMLCFKTKKNVNLIFDHVLLLLQPYILSIL